VRVVGGSLAGRQFNAPRGHRTHPMSDKIRGALFNVLGELSGLTVLDAFAGSGALAIEAVSRGASYVVAIDLDKQASNTMKQNVEALGLGENVKPIRGNAISWSNRHIDQRFDVVLLDPPFDEVLYTSLFKLARHVNDSGLLVLSLPSDEESFKLPGFNLVSQKLYGDAQLVFYRRNSVK
jgi:16S rRNA (guanine966-N2)-methyltransferase